MSQADNNFNLENITKKKPSAKAKKYALIAAVSLVGISIATIITNICIYDSFFERYERPNYDLYPGLYSYSRFKGTLKRELLKIKSGENELQGYYYPTNQSRGLAVLAHGFHAGADDYLPLTEALVNKGYSVLTYDVTGTYSSDGESVVGMCQSLVDLDNVLKFADTDERFSSMPKVVIGHSWGGYAASSVLALHKEIKAAALIAPMNNGSTVMFEKAQQYAGPAANTVKPIMDTYQSILFGDYVGRDGVQGINSTDVPILIAQGVDDTVITPDGQSITAKLANLTNPNVEIYWGRGAQGSHTGIWHSTRAEEYRKSIEAQINALQNTLGREPTDGDRAAVYSAADHRLYSEVNEELVDLIIKTFDKGIGLN